VSCSVHDAVRLEGRGIPTAVVGTEPFLDEALEQSRVLGMSNYPVVLVPHPVQLLTDAELRTLADEAFPRIERLLVDGGALTD
jgi:riboflavin biosynthesis pyrimidine reductase